MPVADFSRVAAADCALSGCVGTGCVGTGCVGFDFGCFDFVGSVADKRIPGIAIGIAGKCAADGRAVDCDTAGSGVTTVGRSAGRCASGKCSRCV